ncbi:hypothetical protein ACAW74_11710 [Fibrella sp. WM1]|uniref:hypothetical protein n=1 Tax=Fibrella musci TaxID=3242485 RepID=UPI0035211701
MNTPQTKSTPIVTAPLPPDQISPKEVLARAAKLKGVARRNWYVLLIIMIIGGVIGYVTDLTSKKKPTYIARIVFNLGGGSGSTGQMGELGALAGAFGLGQATPDASIFSGENFTLYVRSKPVLETTLMKTVKINGVDTLLVNYYMAHSGIRDKEWEEDETLKKFMFTGPKKREDFTPTEQQAMYDIYERLSGEMEIKPVDRKSSFLSLVATTEDGPLSKAFVENHLLTIEDDYKKKQTKKTREMLTLLENRVDSLSRRLTGTENKLASYMNQNQQVVVAEGRLQENRLTRNSTFLQQQYFAAVTSLDNMKLSLIREQPLFTTIEPVILPLYRKIPAKAGMQAGLAIGLVLGLVAIFLRESFRSPKPTV